MAYPQPSDKQKQRLKLRGINKQKAKERDGFNCRNCGKRDWRLSVHHVKPLNHGGDDSLDNLVTLCGKCHDQVHYTQAPYLYVRFSEGDFEFSRERF